MLVALESFRDFRNNKKLAIIGDMLELGEESDLEHQKIIDYCKEHKIEFMTVGPIFNKHNKDRAYKNVEGISSELNMVNATTILLKGSRGIELEKLITLL